MAEYHGAARAVGGCAIYVRYCLWLPNFFLYKMMILIEEIFSCCVFIYMLMQ